MENENLRGNNIGYLTGDPDTDWMYDLYHKERRERIDELIRECLKNSEFQKPKGPVIFSTANPSKSWLYEEYMPNPKAPFGQLSPSPLLVDKLNDNDIDGWKKHCMSGMPVIDSTKMFLIDYDWQIDKPKWYNKIVLPYISIAYDKYWRQLVFGYGKWRIGVGCIYWSRLFGVGKPLNKGFQQNKHEHGT